MESRDQADAGYPEEGPPGSDPTGGSGDSEVREKSRAGKESERAPSSEEGTATGNPDAAGGDE